MIGVSGGLDSTHALIVVARVMDRLGLPRENVLAYTLPGFATSEHTKGNAWKLMQALGVSAHEIDIRPSAEQMLRDLEHPYAEGEKDYDITFENVQAGERTSHLFRLANHHNALVIGTGDLSELALGWATYGVGDQMSHYAVNASVPKSLISFMLRWVIDTGQFDARRQRRPAVGDRHRDLARADPRRRRQADRGLREQGRPVRAAGLLPVLHPALRPPAEQGRVHGAPRLGRRGARPVAGPDPAPTAATSTRSPTSSTGSPSSSTASSASASSSAPRSRTRRRSARAARCRRAATGARRATPRRASGWTSWEERAVIAFPR